jgi:hypothetical protein
MSLGASQIPNGVRFHAMEIRIAITTYMNRSDMYENKNMDRFQVYENKSGNNFDETAQEKLIWFLKSFIQELN